ncbi:glycosyltransferase family 2 protein [Silvibacterium bohemicum]|nr:glycosyltransferase [Silvibacterium bohemicum]
MHVAICIATCKRPKLLEQLLFNISALTFERTNPVPQISIVVVDNDAAGTAKDVCQQVSLPWPLTYVIEPKRGIASARNRALRNAENADFIALIDDDEAPAPEWLDELLWTRSQFNADVVSGPVVPIFTEDVADWIKAGKFFYRQIHESGKALNWFATNNVLISRRVLNQLSSFDERFQLTGGEDLQYSMKVHRAGFKIVFAKDAIVSEVIDADRANVQSILKRAYQGGNCQVFVERSLDTGISAWITRFAKGCARTVQGIIEVMVAVLKGRVAALESMRRVCTGVGMLSGLIGFRYEPYRVIKGRSTA